MVEGRYFVRAAQRKAISPPSRDGLDVARGTATVHVRRKNDGMYRIPHALWRCYHAGHVPSCGSETMNWPLFRGGLLQFGTVNVAATTCTGHRSRHAIVGRAEVSCSGVLLSPAFSRLPDRYQLSLN